MNDQHWCTCGAPYRLHLVLKAVSKPNGSMMKDSRWWWICHTCFSFEAYDGGD